jgi:hypothetical protein
MGGIYFDLMDYFNGGRDRLFKQQRKSRRHKSWTDTVEEQLLFHNIKAGVPMYEWKDVTFYVEEYSPTSNVLYVMVKKLEISEKYNLMPLIKELPVKMQTMTTNEIFFELWTLLIDSGRFPYPVELLN